MPSLVGCSVISVSHNQSHIESAGSGHKSATLPAPVLEPNVPAIAYRIEQSWPLGREPVWKRSLARVASGVGTAIAGLAGGRGELRSAVKGTAA
jgi:hypothetical protein